MALSSLGTSHSGMKGDAENLEKTAVGVFVPLFCHCMPLSEALVRVLEATSFRTLPFPAVWCGVFLVAPWRSSRAWRGPGGGDCESLSEW